MSRRNVGLVAALSVLLLAACASQAPTAAQNEGADAEANMVEGAPPDADPGQPGINGIVDPVPPPDAVSHPDGYLPNAGDAPPSGPEPTAVDQPRSEEPPPATEDEHIHRNKQTGG